MSYLHCITATAITLLFKTLKPTWTLEYPLYRRGKESFKNCWKVFSYIHCGVHCILVSETIFFWLLILWQLFYKNLFFAYWILLFISSTLPLPLCIYWFLILVFSIVVHLRLDTVSHIIITLPLSKNWIFEWSFLFVIHTFFLDTRAL